MKKFSSLKQRKRQTSSTNLVHSRHVQHRNPSSGTLARTTHKRFRSSESTAQTSNSIEEEEEETLGTSILSNETLASERLKSQDSGTNVRAKESTLKSEPSESSLTLSLPKEIRTSWLDNERSLDVDALGQAQQLLSKPPAENRTTAKSIFSTNKSVILDPHRSSISGRHPDAPEQAMAGYHMARPPDYPPEVFTDTSECDDVHQYQSVDGSFNSHSDREFRSVSSKFTAPGTQASDVELAGGPVTRIDSDVSVGTKPFAVLSQLDVGAVTDRSSVTGGTTSGWKPSAPVSGRAADANPASSSVELNRYWSADFLPSNFGPSGVTERGCSESELAARTTNSYNKSDRPFAVASEVNLSDGLQIAGTLSSIDSVASSTTSDQNTVASLQNIPGKMADLYQAFAASGREVENVTPTSSASFPVFTEVTVIKSRTYVYSEETSQTVSREMWPRVRQEHAAAASSASATTENAPGEQTFATGKSSAASPLEWKQEALRRPEIEFLTRDSPAQRLVKHQAVSSTHVGTNSQGMRDGKYLEKVAESGTQGELSRSKSEATTLPHEPLDSSTASGVDLTEMSQKQLPSSKGREYSLATSPVCKKGERLRKLRTPTASGGVSPKPLVEARTEHAVVSRLPSVGSYSPKAVVPAQHLMVPAEWRPIGSVVQPGLAPIEEKLERSTTSFSITDVTAPTNKDLPPSNYDTRAAEALPAICHDTSVDSALVSLETDRSLTEVATSNAMEERRLLPRAPSLVENLNSDTSLIPYEQQSRDETTEADVSVPLCITNDFWKTPSTGSLKTVTESVCRTTDELGKPTPALENSDFSLLAPPLKAVGSGAQSISSVTVNASSSANIPSNFVERRSTESLKSLPGISGHENAELLRKPSTASEKSEGREELAFSVPYADGSSATVSVGDSLEHLGQLGLLDHPFQKGQPEYLDSPKERNIQDIVSPVNETELGTRAYEFPGASRELVEPELMVYSASPSASPGIFADDTFYSYRWDYGVQQQGIDNDQAEQVAESKTAAAAQGHPVDERLRPTPNSTVAQGVREAGFLYEEPLRRPVVSTSWAETSMQEEERRRSSSGAGTRRAPLTVPAALAEEHLSHEQRRRSSAPFPVRGSRASSGIPSEEGAFSSSAFARRVTNTAEPASRNRQRAPGRSGSLTPETSGGKRTALDHHGDASRKSKEAMPAATTTLADRRSIAAEGTFLEEPDLRPFSEASERSTSEAHIPVSDSRSFLLATSDALSPRRNGSTPGVSGEPELTHRKEDIRPAGFPDEVVTMLLAENLSPPCEEDRVTGVYEGCTPLPEGWGAHEDSIDFEESCGEKSTALDDRNSTTFTHLSSGEVAKRFGPGVRRASGESLDERTQSTGLYTTLVHSAGHPPHGCAVNQTSPLLEPPFEANEELPAAQSVTQASTRDLIGWYEDEDDGDDGSTFSVEESQQPVEEIRLLAEAASRRRLLPPLVNMFPCVEERARLYRPPTMLPPPLHLLSAASLFSTDAKPTKEASRNSALSRREAIDEMASVVALSFAFVAFVAAAGILLTGPTEHARPPL